MSSLVPCLPTNTGFRPSSNWFTLQKSLVRHGHTQKRRKIYREESSASVSAKSSAFPRDISPPSPKRHEPDSQNEFVDLETTEVKNGESIAALRRMVLGKVEYKVNETAPGRYVALDCEMVGVGIEGNESSLARVSIVDYTGAIILDVFVRQRERVVDYRTKWSGVRSTDLADLARPFQEVQRTVSDLIRDRILVGHALHNDLKALLLSQPSPQIRDTQLLAYKHRIVKSRRPALRVLVKQELGIVIQGGEHSSVTDARATMALFRLYKKQWDGDFKLFRTITKAQTKNKVDSCPSGKAIVLGRSTASSDVSVPRGRKRACSESFRSDDDSVGKRAEVSILQRRPRSPTLSAPRGPTQYLFNTPERPKENTSRLPARAGSIKEVQKKAIRIGNDGKKDSVVGNNLGGRRKVTNEKWWKSLGGGKQGTIKP